MKTVIDAMLLVLLLKMAITDMKEGKIKNREILIYYGLIGILSICRGDFIWFIGLSGFVVLMIAVFGKTLPLEKIGGGDIKYIIVTALFLKGDIFAMLIWSLSFAVAYAIFFRRERIRMAPFFLIGILLTYYIK